MPAALHAVDLSHAAVMAATLGQSLLPTTVSSEEHLLRMGWPLKRFKSGLAEWTWPAACLGN